MYVPLLQRASVLVLNRQWLAISSVTPIAAFGHLSTGSARALRLDESAIQSIDWEGWQKLDVDARFPSIGTPRGPIRIPTVIVLAHYGRVPMVVPSFGFRGLWERDGGRCQYTGRTLLASEANIDHVIPRSRGGRDCWENCVLADRRVNTRKGSRTLAEAGLKLLRQPRAPQAVPSTLRIRNSWMIDDWNHFLKLSS